MGLIACLYAVMSVLTFAAYAFDKSAARQGRWRTPEKTLHLMALAGGWPGALAAQRLLRHKSAKREFLVVFWIVVAVNLCALAWLMGEGGAARLAAPASKPWGQVVSYLRAPDGTLVELCTRMPG